MEFKLDKIWFQMWKNFFKALVPNLNINIFIYNISVYECDDSHLTLRHNKVQSNKFSYHITASFSLLACVDQRRT